MQLNGSSENHVLSVDKGISRWDNLISPQTTFPQTHPHLGGHTSTPAITAGQREAKAGLSLVLTSLSAHLRKAVKKPDRLTMPSEVWPEFPGFLHLHGSQT